MTTNDPQPTDIGPAAPAPNWCLPGAEPSWDVLAEEYGGGMICSWTRTFPPRRPVRRRVDPGRGPHRRRPPDAQRPAGYDVRAAGRRLDTHAGTPGRARADRRGGRDRRGCVRRNAMTNHHHRRAAHLRPGRGPPQPRRPRHTPPGPHRTVPGREPTPRGRRRIPAAWVDDPQGWLNGTVSDVRTGDSSAENTRGSGPLYFVPQTRSYRAVSAMPWALTSLPLR